MRRRVAALSAALVVGTLPACTLGVRRERPRASDRPLPTASIAVPATCPAEHAEPDPRRPRVTLAFDVDESHRVVTGTEKVVFTPDRPVTELVFRLWANGPAPVENGGRIEVTKASLPMSFEPGGAGPGTQGTILRLALPAPAPAGKPVTAELSFRLTLPYADVDRWGHTPQSAWWGSAHPMLAWVRGRGWHTTPAVEILGETAVNEAAFHDVTVEAPFTDTVFGIGLDAEPEVTGAGKRRWRFTNPVARDVAVSVGRFTTENVVIEGVPTAVAIGEDVATGEAAGRLSDYVQELTRRSLQAFIERFGPYPYPSLTLVAIDHIQGAGVEYPGFIWLGSRRYEVVVPHEVAHEWFYGLVGNDQGADPWLDEAFASYGEALVHPESADRFLGAVDSEGRVGRPMAYWDDHERSYGPVVYAKGAGALLTARAEVGAEGFDALLRCFVNEHAHGIIDPEDVRDAFTPAPRVIQILREVGALS